MRPLFAKHGGQWMSLECRAEFDIIHNHTYSTDNEIIEIQGLVHMKLTSMGFSCITDLLLPRTNNLILFRNIQPARNPLGKFVIRWWRHKRSTIKQAKICSKLPTYWPYFLDDKAIQIWYLATITPTCECVLSQSKKRFWQFNIHDVAKQLQR